ncbi:MAG: formate-dependent phosphoribosylglycinamide formyltransferase [Bacteroidia bacterium]
MNSVEIGTPYTQGATRVLLLGSGELGKELVIEFQRLGIEVTAADNYKNAPAMQVAHHSEVIDMSDKDALKELIYKVKPHYIVPEVEAIATDALLDLESEGYNVIPTARATNLTMNREGIRNLVTKELKLRTSPFKFAGSIEEVRLAAKEIGFPCVIKPVMSSSGKGQGIIKKESDIQLRWDEAISGARGKSSRVIIEGFVDFDSEITLLTISHRDGVSFCEPIGHRQENGDYQESWQPHPMSQEAILKARKMAEAVVKNLGGYGLFGVEFFIKGDDVIFSELSPRPHDTGMVTLISQELSEFALHARAILGLPIHEIVFYGPSASKALLVKGYSSNVKFGNLEKIIEMPGLGLRLFGKPQVKGERRMGVILARASNIDEAIKKAITASYEITTEL